MGSSFSQSTPNGDERKQFPSFSDDFDPDDYLEKGGKSSMAENAEHTNSRKAGLLSRILCWIVNTSFPIGADSDRGAYSSSSVPAAATHPIRPWIEQATISQRSHS
jgi:hypothetical protein